MEETKAVAVTTINKFRYLPLDIIFYILSKLPLKSLKKFECVCKSWAALFQTSYFMTMYRNNFISDSNHYDDTYLVLQHGEGQSGHYYGGYPYEFYLLPGQRFENRIKIDWPPPFQEDGCGIYIMGTVSINGILCLNQKCGRRLVLWNPIAREFKVIPRSPLVYVPPNRRPRHILHGFGYDHVTDDYKVIRFVDSFRIVVQANEAGVNEDRSSYEIFWEIYSLRSDSWKKLDVNIPNRYHYSLNRRIGVYTNGVCHWWARTNHSPNISPNVEECLVSFDFSNEALITTPMPSYLDVSIPSDYDRSYRFVERQLVILNESIALISITDLERTTIHISILGEFGVKESWTKLFTIPCIPASIHYFIGVGSLSNIVFVKKNDGKLACIDLNTKIIEEVDVKVERHVFVGKYKKSSLAMEGMNN
jgi:molecular chaperone HtpG